MRGADCGAEVALRGRAKPLGGVARPRGRCRRLRVGLLRLFSVQDGCGEEWCGRGSGAVCVQGESEQGVDDAGAGGQVWR